MGLINLTDLFVLSPFLPIEVKTTLSFSSANRGLLKGQNYPHGQQRKRRDRGAMAAEQSSKAITASISTGSAGFQRREKGVQVEGEEKLSCPVLMGSGY